MKIMYLEGVSYLSICLFPIGESFRRAYLKIASEPDYAVFDLHPNPHITVFYAPLARGISINSVSRVVQDKTNELRLISALRFDDVYTTPFKTINLSICSTDELKNAHFHLFKLLYHYLHEAFLTAFEQGEPSEESLPILHTSNLGEAYKPHLTLGRGLKEEPPKAFLENIKSLFDFNNLPHELYINDGSNNELKKKLKLY